MRPVLALALLSALLAPAAVSASDASSTPGSLRITTGVVAPVVLNSKDFTVSADAMTDVIAPRPEVVLGMKVNEKGMAEDVRIVKSASPKVDAQVLNAVRDFRFRPATLNNEPVAVDLQLTVLVQR